MRPRISVSRSITVTVRDWMSIELRRLEECAADGIYSGWYTRPDGTRHAAAISLGRRPTFYETAHASLLEAHLLDFSGDLYDERARVAFVARLRGEVKFDGVEALIEQIGRDCEQARQILLG